MFCLLVTLEKLVPSINTPLPLYKIITCPHNTTICCVSHFVVLKEIKSFHEYTAGGFTNFDVLKSVYEIIQDNECINYTVQYVEKPKLVQHKKHAYGQEE